MPTSPSVQNYHIGKGVVTFNGSDMGNAPRFLYTPKVEKKEHFTSREGTKIKDFTAITQVGATIKVTLDEITPENLGIFALGDVSAGTITGMTDVEKSGTITVTGTNDVGQRVSWTGDVSFVPSGDFSFITDTDDFSVIELEAEVQKSATDGSFGTWTVVEGTA
jgi:hypothetical protein